MPEMRSVVTTCLRYLQVLRLNWIIMHLSDLKNGGKLNETAEVVRDIKHHLCSLSLQADLVVK